MVMSQMRVLRVRWVGWAEFVSLNDSDWVWDGVDDELAEGIGVDILSKVLKGDEGKSERYWLSTGLELVVVSEPRLMCVEF